MNKGVQTTYQIEDKRIDVILGDLCYSSDEIIVIPCSVQGTISTQFEIGLKRMGVFFNEKESLLGDINFYDKGKSNIIFATTVDNNKSNLEAIELILKKLVRLTKVDGIQTISIPLLGTGAGGLNPVEVYNFIKKYFIRDSNHTAKLKIWITDEKLYSKLTGTELLPRNNQTIFVNVDEIDFEYYYDLKKTFPDFNFITNDKSEVYSSDEFNDIEKKISTSICYLEIVGERYNKRKMFVRGTEVARNHKIPIILLGLPNINKPNLSYDFKWIEGFDLAKINEFINPLISNKQFVYKKGKKLIVLYETTFNNSALRILQNKLQDYSLILLDYNETNVIEVINYHIGVFNECGCILIFVTEEFLKNIDSRKWKGFIKDNLDTIKLIFVSNEKNNIKIRYTLSDEITVIEGFNIEVIKEEISKYVFKTEEYIKLNDPKTPDFISDYVTENQPDLLEITNDVKAFAALIAYKNNHPPLSIALFGDWGSGKSFFMKQLLKQLKDINDGKSIIGKYSKTEQEKIYCNKILSIEFNAWHYMDANLWASLVCHIFDKLNEYLNGNTDENAINELFNELEIIKNIQEEAVKQVEYIRSQKEQIIIKRDNSNKIKLEKELEFKAGLPDIIKSCLKDNVVEVEISKAKEKLGIDKLNIESEKALTNISEYYGSAKSYIIEIFKTVLNIRNYWFAILLLIIIPLIIVWIFKYFQPSFFASGFTKIVMMLTSILVFINHNIYKIKPVFDTIKKGKNYLDKAIIQYNTIKEERFKDYNIQIQKLEAEISQFDVEIQDLSKKHFELEIKKTEIENEIKNNRQSKLISNYIKQRFDSGDYQKHLGIISMIRQDFENLSKYIVGKDEDSNKTNLESNEKAIERIVLFIDDLDRCTPQRVVEVLQSIHLILAHPLFIVVVGVDHRWLSQSIVIRYKHLLCISNGDGDKKNEDKNKGNSITNHASANDYLEKIFQIAFHIQPISIKATKRLVDELLKESVIIEQIEKQIEVKENVLGVLSLKRSEVSSKEGFTEYKSDVKSIKELMIEQDSIDSDKIDSDYPVNPEKLLIMQEEIDFIKSLSWLIGKSPRAVKRYINTYRIIRSNANLSLSDKPIEDYKAVMLLLGLVIRSSDPDCKLINEISASSKPFNIIVAESKLSVLDKSNIEELNLDENLIKEHLQIVSRFSFSSIVQNKTQNF